MAYSTLHPDHHTRPVRRASIACIGVLILLAAGHWHARSAPFWSDSWAASATQPAPVSVPAMAARYGGPVVHTDWTHELIDAARPNEPVIVIVYDSQLPVGTSVCDEALRHPHVRAALQSMRCVRASIQTGVGRDLVERFAVTRVPQLLLVGPDARAVARLPLDPIRLSTEVRLFRARYLSPPLPRQPCANLPPGRRR